MRLMEQIRQHGRTGLIIFLVIFVISVFAGLGVQQFTRMRGNMGGPEQTRKHKPPRLVTENKLDEYAMRVNGQPVTNERFQKVLDQMTESFGRQEQDPIYILDAYAQTLQHIVNQEAITQKAQEMGLKVTSEDLKKKRDEAVQQYLKGNQEPTGNLLRDIGQKLGSQREYRNAWAEYLASQDKTEADWEADTRMTILFEKCRDAFQAEADTKKEAEALDKKKKIDEALAAGTSFSDLAVKYSDAPSQNGGDLGAIGRGLLQPDPEKVLFSTPVGQVSDWVEIPMGWQRFEVYAKKEAKGPEYEAEKPKIIERLKEEHKSKPAAEGDKAAAEGTPPAAPADYIPTEDEIAKAYEEVSARQIIIAKTDQRASTNEFRKIVDDAKYEVNDPYLLAYQALKEDKLTPFAEVTFTQLQEVAKNAAVGEGYNYELIRAKLERGNPKTAEPAPAADAGAKPADAAKPEGATKPADAGKPANPAQPEGAAKTDKSTAGDPPAKPATDPPAATGDGKTPAAPGGEPAASGATKVPENMPLDQLFDPAKPIGPVYALAIGLFLKEIQDDTDGHAGYFPYYIIAKTYSDWLDDTTVAKDQPVDRKKARQDIEANLAIAADRSSYNPQVHVSRALNLIWLERKDEARKSLELAEKYAAPAVGGVWDLIIKGYGLLDDTAKVQELQDAQNKLREEELKKQLEEQRKSGQGAAPPLVPPGGGTPIQIPPGGGGGPIQVPLPPK